MLMRLLVIASLTLTPLAALADDTSDTSATPAPSSTSYLLGPSSLTSGAGGSTTDSGSLQPAGQSPLQSNTTDATGLTAPNGSVLQAPASSDETLKVIMGDADGPPVQVADSSNPSPWSWLGLSVLFGLVITALVLLARRYPRLLAPMRAIRTPRPRPHNK